MATSSRTPGPRPQVATYRSVFDDDVVVDGGGGGGVSLGHLRSPPPPPPPRPLSPLSPGSEHLAATAAAAKRAYHLKGLGVSTASKIDHAEGSLLPGMSGVLFESEVDGVKHVDESGVVIDLTGDIIDSPYRGHLRKDRVKPKKNFHVVPSVNPLVNPREGIFAADKILAHRHIDGRDEYLVQWTDHPPSFNSWEPEENVKVDPQLWSEWQKMLLWLQVDAERITARRTIAKHLGMISLCELSSLLATILSFCRSHGDRTLWLSKLSQCFGDFSVADHVFFPWFVYLLLVPFVISVIWQVWLSHDEAYSAVLFVLSRSFLFYVGHDTLFLYLNHLLPKFTTYFWVANSLAVALAFWLKP